MLKKVTAYQTEDGQLFEERTKAEAHEIMKALVEKFGDKKAVELSVIVDERDWFEKLFSDVKKDKPMMGAGV